MPEPRSRVRASPGILSLLLLAPLAATPQKTQTTLPNVILFGGSWGPEGNQASIELHLAQLVDALKARSPTVLYGGPTPGARVVQVDDQVADSDGKALALVLDKRIGFDVRYRPTTVKASLPGTKEKLEQVIRASDAAVPLVIFGVGHGNRTKTGKLEQSTLSMWGTEDDDAATESEVSRWLEKRSAPTAMMLGQCHSGGFLELSFKGKGHRKITEPVRCVLASVPADRAASGCTSDLGSPGAKAFMSLVAAALTDKGNDLDGDGKVGLSEAFAVARVEDRTVNVPVRSSEAWLRQLVGSRAAKLGRMGVEELIAIQKNTKGMDRKDELFVLRELGKKIGITKVDKAESAYDELMKQIDEANKVIDARIRSMNDVRARLQDALFERWPELTNPYHPVSRKLLFEEIDRIAGFLRSLPEYPELEALEAELSRRDKGIESLERQAALIERWLRAAENLAFEKIVRTKRPKADQRALDRLLECESIAPL